ncbi:MAG: hypothetical protein GXX79_16235 [Actinomycetales bacterium]|nr:hypothetical protein [Actinomycetales bacterium]
MSEGRPDPAEARVGYLTGDRDAEVPAADRRVLDGLRSVLSLERTWQDPPPGLRERLLATATGERRSARDALPSAASPGVPPRVPPARVVPTRSDARHRRRWTASGRRTRWLSAVGAAAAAVVAAVLVLGPSGEEGDRYALAGVGTAAGASATAVVRHDPAGVAISLRVEGLSPAPAGHYYAAWLVGEAGAVPVGSFHWRERQDRIGLWSGAPVEGYPELRVTLQREGDPVAPSGRVVLRGRVDG